MSREHTGTITIKTLADGTRAFHLRFIDRGRRERVTLHERRGCTCGCGGGWNERTAAVELKNIVARVEAGVWQKIKPDKPQRQREMPTFHEYASAWLEAKIAGTIGDRPIDVNTQNDYRWRLSKHLLPFFAKYRLDAIDAATCQAFKAKKLAEAAELRAAIEAGADIRDKSGKVARPLGPASIRKLITTLAAILDEAIEDGHIERNPAPWATDARPRAEALEDVPRDGRARRAHRRRRRPRQPNRARLTCALGRQGDQRSEGR
jgi:hypothetical protein